MRINVQVDEFNWMSVNEWSKDAGSMLGTNRYNADHNAVDRRSNSLVSTQLSVSILLETHRQVLASLLTILPRS